MKERILFVDDELHILQGLERLLHGMRDEWEMVFVTNADDALRHAQDLEFDAVVSDVSMPGKDGFELLAMLQSSENTRNVPVIIVTGLNEYDLKRRALDLGAADLLNKPPSSEDLIARLRSVLRLKSYQDSIKNENQML